MTTPELSIVVPLYNCEEFIEACVDSIINQTFPFEKMEVIIIDDQSPCNGFEIVKEKYLHTYSNITLLKNDEKLGPGGTRNRAIKLAKADLVTFIDGDDWYHLEFCEDVLKSYAENGADITVGGMMNTVDGVNIRWKSVPPAGIYEGEEKLNLLWSLRVECHSPYRLYNKKLFSEDGIWFTPNAYYEDTSIMPELFYAANKICCIEKIYYYYRYNPTSIVNTSSTKHINDINRAIDNVITVVPVNERGINFIWWLYNHNIFKKRLDYLQSIDTTDFIQDFISLMLRRNILLDKTEENQHRKEICETISNLGHDPSPLYPESYRKNNPFEKEQYPLVSLIMPSFNNGDVIAESITSVLNQTYKNIELIIVDDCSGDNSIEVIKEFSDPRIKLFKNTKNSGVYFSRNVGMFNARGSFITTVDSDDIISKFRVERIIEEFRVSPELMLIETRFIRYKDDLELDIRRFTQGVGNGCFRKDVIKDIGFFLPIQSGGDSEFSSRISAYYGADKVRVNNDFTYWAKIRSHGLTVVNPQGSESREEFISLFKKNQVEALNLMKIDFPWDERKLAKIGMTNLSLYQFSEMSNNSIQIELNSSKNKTLDAIEIDQIIDNLQVKTLNYYYGEFLEFRDYVSKQENKLKQKDDLIETLSQKPQVPEEIHSTPSTPHVERINALENQIKSLLFEEKGLKEKHHTHVESVKDNLRSIEVEKDKISEHYNKVYEQMPGWWLKLGAVIRKVKKN